MNFRLCLDYVDIFDYQMLQFAKVLSHDSAIPSEFHSFWNVFRRQPHIIEQFEKLLAQFPKHVANRFRFVVLSCWQNCIFPFVWNRIGQGLHLLTFYMTHNRNRFLFKRMTWLSCYEKLVLPKIAPDARSMLPTFVYENNEKSNERFGLVGRLLIGSVCGDHSDGWLRGVSWVCNFWILCYI